MVKVEIISESEDDEYKNLPVLSSRSYEQPQTKTQTEATASGTRAQNPQIPSSHALAPDTTPSLYIWFSTLLVNSLLITVQASLQYSLTPDAFSAESMIGWVTSWVSMLPVVYFSFRYGRKKELTWLWFALALFVGSRILSTLQMNRKCLRGQCRPDDLAVIPRLAALFILSSLRMSLAKLALGLVLLSLYYLYLY